MLSSLTNCEEAIDLILTQNRKSREESVNYGLFLTTPEAEAQIPSEVGILDELKWAVNCNNLNYRTIFAMFQENFMPKWSWFYLVSVSIHSLFIKF